MKLIINGDKNLYLDFIKHNPGCAGWEFLLSPTWVEMLQAQGEDVRVVSVVKDENILALMVLVKKFLGQGFFYWYAPRGPLLKNNLANDESLKISKFLLSAVRRLDTKALFIKLEPANKTLDFWTNNVLPRSLAGVYRIIKVKDVQPRQTLILDLNKSIDEIIAAMHPKTRYNIRLAEKKELKIVLGDAKDLAEFWRLMTMTGNRDGFRLHSLKHYKYLLKHSSSVHLFFAQYQGQNIATAMMNIFETQATYLHGGSDYEKRHLMAPYLLQVEMIKYAQTNGALIYDFYGISEEKWPGVTRFKQGFQGEERHYLGTFDVVFRPALYRVYQLIKFGRANIKLLKKYASFK